MISQEQRRMLIAQGAILAASVTGFVMMVTESRGHEAPNGWRYSYACCSDRDCRPVHDATVKEGAGGFTVPSGEVIAYSDKRIKNSPDGEFHWCSVDGNQSSRTICLYVPSRSF